MSRLRFALALAVIVALGSWLRLESVGWPHEHPDEPIVLAVARHMAASGTWDTNWRRTEVRAPFRYDQYNFSSYVLFVHALNRLLPHPPEGARSDRRLLDRYRTASALLGSAVILLTGLLGRRWFGDGTALVAAALTATSVVLYQDSLYARPEAFVTLLSLGFAAVVLEPWRPARSVITSGLLGGLLVSSKFSLLPLLPLPLVVLFLRARTGRIPPPGWGLALLYVVAVGVGFSLGAPYAVWHPWEYLNGVTELLRHYSGGHPPHGLPEGSFLERLAYGARYLVETSGLVVLGAAGLGLVLMLRDGLVERLVVLGAFLLFIVYFMQTRVFFERNFSHALPVLFLAAAYGIVGAARALVRTAWQRAAVATAFTAVALIPGVALCARIRTDVLSGEHARVVRDRVDAAERLLEVPVFWIRGSARTPGDQARALAASLDGLVVLAYPDYGDDGSRNEQERLAGEIGFVEIDRVRGPFTNLVPSTLHTYFAHDVVLLARAGVPTGDMRVEPVLPTALRGTSVAPTLSADGSWSRDGAARETQLRPGLEIYRSRSRVRGTRGVLRLGPLTAARDVLIPFVSGADAQGLRLEVAIEQPDGRVRHRVVENVASGGRWIGLRVRLPDVARERVWITAEDAGDERDQWMGVGIPLMADR